MERRGVIGEKRGQFYLIAAVVIIAIIIGFYLLSNSANSSGNTKIYELKEELGIESGEVLEYGTYSSLDEMQMLNLILSFSGNYTQYAGEDKDIFYVVGNNERIKIITFQEISEGSISVTGGGSSTRFDVLTDEQKVTEYAVQGKKEVIIKINGSEYEFKLKPGENFYFIISQEIGDEVYVAGNE